MFGRQTSQTETTILCRRIIILLLKPHLFCFREDPSLSLGPSLKKKLMKVEWLFIDRVCIGFQIFQHMVRFLMQTIQSSKSIYTSQNVNAWVINNKNLCLSLYNCLFTIFTFFKNLPRIDFGGKSS